jgi:hypothetical protein
MPDLDRSSLLRIRATRSDPPGAAAGDASRRSRYGATLQQFEELLEAAALVGPASRPLPLFYAVEQAGAAIVAARLASREKDLSNHGLKMRITNGDFVSATVIPKPGGGSTFHAVSAAVASQPLISPATLASLWASLPESSGDPLPGDESPRALLLEPYDQPQSGLAFAKITSRAEAWVAGLPEAFGTAANRIAFLQRHLSRYPDAAGWESPGGDQLAVDRDPNHGWMVRLQWPIPHTGSGDERREYLLKTVASYANSPTHGWLRPLIGGGHESPSPLMTWWILLFGLSCLARYHPAEWTAMLDVDKSRIAAGLEAMLMDGLNTIPGLVLNALITDRSGNELVGNVKS